MKNLVLRTVTGVLFVAVMVGSIWYSPVTFAVLFTVISALSTWEFGSVVNRRGDVSVNRLVTAIMSAYLFVASWCYSLCGEAVLFVPYLLILLYVIVSELYRKSEHAVNNWAFTLMGQMYVALPFALLNALEFWDFDVPGFYVLALFVLLWCSDTGAYCTGSLIGRHKLFPSVSPGKTWEGSIGGGVLAVAVAGVGAWMMSDMPLSVAALLHSYVPFWCGFALTVVVFGTLGDLVESLLKRRLGIKDSGHALPGHGGWLDRFDSSLLAAPACVAYLLCCWA